MKCTHVFALEVTEKCFHIGPLLVFFFFTEVGKNINQDKLLRLERYVEDYHKYVSSLNVPPVQTDTDDRRREGQKVRKGRERIICPRRARQSHVSLVPCKAELATITDS